MKTLLLSTLFGFGVTVGTFAVIADNSFWSPAVGVADAEKKEVEAKPLILASEPSVQKGGVEQKTFTEERARAPQNQDMSVVLRPTAPQPVAAAPSKANVVHAPTQKVAAVAHSNPEHVTPTSVVGRPSKLFAVQVASFKTEVEAKGHLERISKEGFGGFIQSADVKGSTYYRVRLGPVESKEDANDLLAQVKQKSWGSDAILASDLK